MISFSPRLYYSWSLHQARKGTHGSTQFKSSQHCPFLTIDTLACGTSFPSLTHSADTVGLRQHEADMYSFSTFKPKNNPRNLKANPQTLYCPRSRLGLPLQQSPNASLIFFHYSDSKLSNKKYTSLGNASSPCQYSGLYSSELHRLERTEWLLNQSGSDS